MSRRELLWRIVSDQVGPITEDDAECIAEQWACEISFDEMGVTF